MNQVWLFFKLIEVVLGSLCMFFHVQGSMYWAEPIPHVLVYCATFVSYTMMAALGAFRLLLTRSSVLSSQLLLTLSAVIFHYFCGILVMRTALRDPHLAAINSSIEYLEHPHFAHCKQQSIAAMITGTMYLMHMFHVFDLLIRLEPGDWRRQATGRINIGQAVAGRAGRAGLFVLSKPVDDFLCSCCPCYFHLAHSQALRFQVKEMEESALVGRFWDFLGLIRRKFFSLAGEESDESFMSTPTITSSSSGEPEPSEYAISLEEEGGGRGPRSNWRGTSDSTSLWAQIEDRSTLNILKARSSQSSDVTVRPSLMDRKGRRRNSIWDDTENREKSEILLVDQNPSYSRMRSVSNAELPRPSRENVVRISEADKDPTDSKKSVRDSKIRFQGDENAEAKDKPLESPSKKSTEGKDKPLESLSRNSVSMGKPESPKSDTEGEKGEPRGSQEEKKDQK